jgi:polysaccharide biosynthesis transport protein
MRSVGHSASFEGLPASAHDDSLLPVRYYLEALKRQLWLIVLVVIVTTSAAVGVLALQTEMYRASTILVLGTPGSTRPPESEEAETIVTLFKSEAVASAVNRRLRLDTEPKELLGRFTAESTDSSAVIEATFEDSDPREAERILRVFSSTFVELLQLRLDVTSDITVFNPPRADPDPVSPNVPTTLAFAIAAGIALGILFAVLREGLDEIIRNRRDAEESFGAPVIGALPKGWKQRPSMHQTSETRGSALERALRMLSSDLEPDPGAKQGLTVVVTSMRPEDGKATIVANLGVTLAREGMDIVCVEADLQYPSLRGHMSIDGTSPGLLDVAAGDVKLASALVPVPFNGSANGRDSHDGSRAGGSLRVMSIGNSQSDASTVLTERQVAGLLAELRANADVSILDISPLGMSEAFPFIRESDRVMLVTRAGRTTRTMAADARAALERLGARDVGVVLVDADSAQLFP